MKNIFSSKWAVAAGAVALGFAAVSCEDEPDKFKPADGVPVVRYIRSTDPATSDSLLTRAFLSNTICIVGENLKSIHELYFNDQKANLNTSLITDNTLIVDIPSAIPTQVTDSMYMVNWAGQVTRYEFKSLVPAPKASTMSCEWAPAGSKAVIYGDFFVNDPSQALVVTDAAGHEAEVDLESFSQTAITITVPDNWEPGYLTLTSIYGKSRSKFRYKDDLNILFDFDGSHGGQPGGNGWHSAKVYADGDLPYPAVDGSYMGFMGDTYDETGWNGISEDNSGMEYWTDYTDAHPRLCDKPDFAEILKQYDINQLQMKFEIFVPESAPWKSTAMTFIFTSTDVVSSTNANNEYRYESGAWEGKGYPRGFYQPYASVDGFNFNTGGQWQTVSMPISTFTYNKSGESMSEGYNKNSFAGLTIAMAGGAAGAECSPVILFDNIRVVPIE